MSLLTLCLSMYSLMSNLMMASCRRNHHTDKLLHTAAASMHTALMHRMHPIELQSILVPVNMHAALHHKV